MNMRLAEKVWVALGLVVACHSVPLDDATGAVVPDDNESGAAGEPSSSQGGSDSGPTAGRSGAGGSAPAHGGTAGEPQSSNGAGETSTAGSDGVAPDPAFEGPSRCTSGKSRDPNASEGPEMNPGFPCIFCHALSNSGTGEADAPIFTFAGTVYPHAHEPSSCIGGGLGGATVVVRDADGQELSAETNASGNFLLEDVLLAPPYSATVRYQGRERSTTTPHSDPDCNRCHTELGDLGAPGRVVLP